MLCLRYSLAVAKSAGHTPQQITAAFDLAGAAELFPKSTLIRQISRRQLPCNGCGASPHTGLAQNSPRAGAVPILTMVQAELPISAHADVLVRAIGENPVVVVIGETGSGKTTQLSQLLYKAGFAAKGGIAVTQPRRVAAVTVARRVAQELDCPIGGEVGYAVRFEERRSPDTKITYVTDGMLLRECLGDPQLRRYSVVILDEAHERSLSTDILFGVLKHLVSRRRPRLRLVITSATLDGEKFSTYFRDCPVFSIPGRCFEVAVVHAAQDFSGTEYVQAAVDTALDIHTSQPEGDVLVFLTGQGEIEQAVTTLQQEVAAMDEDECGDVIVLPLYASLPPDQQALVFVPPPEGCRRIIVATNVAETSITVDGVVYVIDPGMVKQKSYNAQTGLDSLTVVPISRVQATQRAGRAGRTRPGKCYRLYSRRHYEEQMVAEMVPEIMRTSLTSAVLALKALPLDIDVLTFDFLDQPKREALEDALVQLHLLGALDEDGGLTEVGAQLAQLPVDPPLGRTLVAARGLGCLPEAIIVVAMLSSESVFSGNTGPEQIIRRDTEPWGAGRGGAGDRARGRGAHRGGRGSHGSGVTLEGQEELAALMSEGLGDHVFFWRLYQAWQRADFQAGWCTSRGLSVRGMRFARDVTKQLKEVAGSHRAQLDTAAGAQQAARAEPGHRSGSRVKRKAEEADAVAFDVPAGTPAQDRLRRAVLAGCAGRIAHRMDLHNGYRTVGLHATLAALHPHSSRLAPDEDGLLPEWLVFNSLVATARNFLVKVCPVESSWVGGFLQKLRGIDVQRLSGAAPPSAPAVAAAGTTEPAAGQQPAGAAAKGKKNDTAAVDAARARFAARKAARTQ